jgi:SAM-dependent methyltransferase
MWSVLAKFRPEIMAGGFAHDDGLVSLYQRVHALLRSDMTVLDLGCGRGEIFHQQQQDYRASIARIQGKVAKIVGVDVDKGVFDHPHLDERHLIDKNKPLPLLDTSVDIVISDWVLEHIDDPAQFVLELKRVLKPGGWFCARTPNRWGYAGLAARALPNAAHSRVLKILMPSRSEQDVFPTRYKLNTLRDIKKFFLPDTWNNFSFLQNTTPKYFGRSAFIFSLIDIYQRVAPKYFQTNLMVFIQKK